MSHQICTLLRLAQVLERFPVSRSKWYEGVKSGRFPAPVKLGHRTVLWKSSDIENLLNQLHA